MRGALGKLVERLSGESGGLLLWCYEAGPCGYGVYRQLLSLGLACEVVAPARKLRYSASCRARAADAAARRLFPDLDRA